VFNITPVSAFAPHKETSLLSNTVIIRGI